MTVGSDQNKNAWLEAFLSILSFNRWFGLASITLMATSFYGYIAGSPLMAFFGIFTIMCVMRRIYLC